MNPAFALVQKALSQTLVSVTHNWPYLALSILVAAALKAFVDADRVARFLQRWKGAGVLAATGAAVATPFCSCGTTAIILGMMASTMPLAPIVAFMIASPLSSPEELFYSAGLFGWPFALFFFGASIALGLAGGAIAGMLERRGLLAGQTRFERPADSEPAAAAPCSCAAKPAAGRPAFRRIVSPRAPILPPSLETACDCLSATTAVRRNSLLSVRARELGRATLEVARKLLPLFLGFAFLGYLLNGLIPPAWISALFGRGRAYGVPLAASVGLPLYLNSEASLPLVRALLDSGMSQGAIMAFLISGSGTSIGAIAGALTIARWKVVGLVVAVLWLGAIAAGYGFDLLVA